MTGTRTGLTGPQLLTPTSDPRISSRREAPQPLRRPTQHLQIPLDTTPQIHLHQHLDRRMQLPRHTRTTSSSGSSSTSSTSWRTSSVDNTRLVRGNSHDHNVLRASNRMEDRKRSKGRSETHTVHTFVPVVNPNRTNFRALRALRACEPCDLPMSRPSLRRTQGAGRSTANTATSSVRSEPGSRRSTVTASQKSPSGKKRCRTALSAKRSSPSLSASSRRSTSPSV
ncbi:hypothetical protein BH23ACT3_BH23ACT3_11600 [soil metagenome]